MAGRKVFTRETLSSLDVNGYLMDQAVMRFPTAAARDAAIPVAQRVNGMASWLDSTAQVEVVDGGAWVPINGGARGWIAGCTPAGSVAPNGSGAATLGQTAAANVRSGERLEHVVSLVLVSTTVQTAVVTLARFDAGTGARTVVATRSAIPGPAAEDSGVPVHLVAEDFPAAGNWFWRIEGLSNVTTGLPVVGQGSALHTVKVTRRA